MKRIGILYHPMKESAKRMAEEVENYLSSQKLSPWICSAWEEAAARLHMPGTDLVISVGGDGTILRAARAIVPFECPVLGIKVGRLGFLTELMAEEALARLPAFLRGEGWIDERAMLQATLLPGPEKTEGQQEKGPAIFHALNDVVAGRQVLSRAVYIEARVDRQPITTFKVDGLIVATATGSTGYSLATGGPVLYPQSRDILLSPIAPHLTLRHTLVLPPTSVVELRIVRGFQVSLSIDGHVNLPLASGDAVEVRASPHKVRFLRAQPTTYFYQTLEQRLKGNV